MKENRLLVASAPMYQNDDGLDFGATQLKFMPQKLQWSQCNNIRQSRVGHHYSDLSAM